MIPSELVNYQEIHDCREDEASTLILQLIFTEISVKIFSMLATSLLSIVLKKWILSKEDWRPPVKESEEIVWVIGFQLTMFFGSIVFPYFALIQPLFNLLVFLTYYLFITRVAKKPVSQSTQENTGLFISIFQLASLFVNITFLTLALMTNFKHYTWLSDPSKTCGPFPNLTAFYDPFIEWLYGSNIVEVLLYMLLRYSVLILFTIAFIMWIYRKYNVKSVLKQFVDEQLASYAHQENSISRLINKKLRKIEVLEREAKRDLLND